MELHFTPQRIIKTLLYMIYENGALYKTEHMIRAIVFWGITIVLWLGNYFCFITSISIAFVVYFCIGGWKYIRLIYATLPRDMRYVKFNLQLVTFCFKIYQMLLYEINLHLFDMVVTFNLIAYFNLCHFILCAEC